MTSSLPQTTFFVNTQRFFFVRYAEGFLLDGKLNLGLSRHLYWVSYCTLCAVTFTIFPTTPVLREGMEFPKNNDLGKICLLVDVDDIGYTNHPKFLICLVFSCIVILNSLSNYGRSKFFMTNWCTKGTMACIGKYCRNAISFRTEAILGMAVACRPIAFQFRLMAYKRLPPLNVFYIETFCAILFDHLVVFVLSFCLSRYEIPTIKEQPRTVKFYVSRPRSLEPRRPNLPVTLQVCQGTSVGQRFCLVPATVFCSTNQRTTLKPMICEQILDGTKTYKVFSPSREKRYICPSIASGSGEENCAKLSSVSSEGDIDSYEMKRTDYVTTGKKHQTRNILPTNHRNTRVDHSWVVGLAMDQDQDQDWVQNQFLIQNRPGSRKNRIQPLLTQLNKINKLE